MLLPICHMSSDVQTATPPVWAFHFDGRYHVFFVHLNIPRPDANQMGWEQEPRDHDIPEAGADSDLHRHV
jgi:hypothetical protein